MKKIISIILALFITSMLIPIVEPELENDGENETEEEPGVEEIIEVQTDWHCHVLWDDGHDSDGDELYNDTGNYHDFYENISARCFETMEHDYSSITANNLTNIDILILEDPETEITSGERTVISSYVSSGGHLLIFGEWVGAFNITSVNALIAPYCIQFNTSLNSEATAYNTFVSHDITENVNNISAVMTGVLNVTSPSTVLGTDNEGYDFLACYDGSGSGKGRVVVISDSDVNKNGDEGDNNFNRTDNQNLMFNSLDWLLNGTTPRSTDDDDPSGGTSSSGSTGTPSAITSSSSSIIMIAGGVVLLFVVYKLFYIKKRR